MTFDDLKRQNRRLCKFYDDFGLRHRYQEQIAPKLTEIDIEKLHMKFSALNVDFDSPGTRKPAHEGVKKRYPRKSRYFIVVGQSFVKTVADRHGHAVYHSKH